MSDNWHWAKGQQQFGPATLERLKQMAASGELSRSDLVWTEGMAQWTPAAQVPDLFPPAAPDQPLPPPPVAHAPMHGGVPNYFSQPLGTPPPNYLVQSILVTVCCCLPFGIPAIVYAAQVNGKFRAGDIQGAYESSRKASFWSWMAFGFGIGANLIVGGIQFIMVQSGR